MKFMKRAFGEFEEYEMTRSVRFCLSFGSLKRDFITFEMNIISKRKHIVDMVFVVTLHVHAKMILHVWYMIFMMGHYPLNNSNVV